MTTLFLHSHCLTHLSGMANRWSAYSALLFHQRWTLIPEWSQILIMRVASNNANRLLTSIHEQGATHIVPIIVQHDFKGLKTSVKLLIYTWSQLSQDGKLWTCIILKNTKCQTILIHLLMTSFLPFTRTQLWLIHLAFYFGQGVVTVSMEGVGFAIKGGYMWALFNCTCCRGFKALTSPFTLETCAERRQTV